MNDVTRILSAIEQGGPQAAEQLLPLVYEEMRRWRRGSWPRRNQDRRSRLRPWSTRRTSDWSMTLPGDGIAGAISLPPRARRCGGSWSRTARAKKRLKRGGGLARREFNPDGLVAPELPEELLALDEALTRLATADRQAADVVQLRIFAGLTVKECAIVLGVSSRTVDHAWAYARAWLLAELQDDDV